MRVQYRTIAVDLTKQQYADLKRLASPGAGDTVAAIATKILAKDKSIELPLSLALRMEEGGHQATTYAPYIEAACLAKNVFELGAKLTRPLRAEPGDLSALLVNYVQGARPSETRLLEILPDIKFLEEPKEVKGKAEKTAVGFFAKLARLLTNILNFLYLTKTDTK